MLLGTPLIWSCLVNKSRLVFSTILANEVLSLLGAKKKSCMKGGFLQRFQFGLAYMIFLNIPCSVNEKSRRKNDLTVGKW